MNAKKMKIFDIFIFYHKKILPLPLMFVKNFVPIN